jgi:hypothetical protein
MRRIFEDILDDIDLKDDSSSVSHMDNDVVDISKYDFVIYLLDERKFNKDVDDARVEYINTILERQLDVYLDSYYLELFKLDDEWVENNPKFFIKESSYENTCCRIFFNVDGNVMHLLNFFDSVYRVNATRRYLYDNKYLVENDAQPFSFNERNDSYVHVSVYGIFDKKYNNYPSYFFKRNCNKNYHNFGQLEEQKKYLVDSLFKLFYQDKHVLKFNGFDNDDDIKQYLAQTVDKFIKNKKRL